VVIPLIVLNRNKQVISNKLGTSGQKRTERRWEMTKVKCQMEKYSIRTMEPPHEFDVVGEFEIEDVEREEDGSILDNGQEFYKRLCWMCRSLGQRMRFYSTSSTEDYDYKVVVYGEFEQTSKYQK